MNKLNNLPIDQQEQIRKINNPKIKEKVIEYLNNPKFMKYYNTYYKSLSPSDKLNFDDLSIIDKCSKIVAFSKLLKEKKNTEHNVINPVDNNVDNDDNVNNNHNVDDNVNNVDNKDKEHVLSNKQIQSIKQYNKSLTNEDVNVNNVNNMNNMNNVNEEDIKPINLQEKFKELMNIYYNFAPYNKKYVHSNLINYELEIRFGLKGHKTISYVDYMNLIKKLNGLGFIPITGPNGIETLKISFDVFNSETTLYKQSNIRIEINYINAIQEYCKTNDLKALYEKYKKNIQFVEKKNVYVNNEKIQQIMFNDFNFKVALQQETTINTGIINNILTEWENYKKMFRFLNRVTFIHKDYPVKIDVSLVKSSSYVSVNNNDNFKIPIKTYTIEESNVFENEYKVEIEIEVDNDKINPETSKFSNSLEILNSLKSCIKMVLGSLQNSQYPIPLTEQKTILENYMKLLHKDKYNGAYVRQSDFLGPSSVTLQLSNISEINANCLIPNIRKDFVVTDKADGERNLLYINTDGHIYLINTLMNVVFTGCYSNNKDIYNSLLDGELITNDKNNNVLNLFAAFDIYYFKGEDIRHYPFIKRENKEDKNDKDNNKYRLLVLKKVIELMQLNSILNKQQPPTSKKINYPSLTINAKKFYPTGENDTIFNGCSKITSDIESGRYNYNTDGLIFTHKYYGVSSSEENKAGPLKKMTWEYSFKWKPPKDNTIDFLIKTKKDDAGNDIISNIYTDGLDMNKISQIDEYKTINLYCAFSKNNEKEYIYYLNPLEDVLNYNIPEFKGEFADTTELNNHNEIRLFVPNKPHDATAGILNIMLKRDNNGNGKMFAEDNDIFDDNAIVEFSYDITKNEGWRWIPKRIRYDKTIGNAYNTANNNWESINFPVTIEMITTGFGIPSQLVNADVYYNTSTHITSYMTDRLKRFHNLYVKSLLIESCADKSQRENLLIDYACGKGGDLSKWIEAKLKFVFGIDYSKDNIENKQDGICVRYLESHKKYKNMFPALFLHGNTSKNIKKGVATDSDKSLKIIKSIFGTGPLDESLGKGVSNVYGIAKNGFNISSCQFALHYYFENPSSIKGFIENLCECTCLNGYFIATAYDGEAVFNQLKEKKLGESIQIIEAERKLWGIIKEYEHETFEANSSSLGYKINVYQESINNYISEFLINKDYFIRLMDLYGFSLLAKEECLLMGLPNSTGMFNELFNQLEASVKANPKTRKEYGANNVNALNMSPNEKRISFLNRYWVFKKNRNVNVDDVEVDLSEYSDVANALVEKRLKDANTENINLPLKQQSKKNIPLNENIVDLHQELELKQAIDIIPDKKEEKIENVMGKVVEENAAKITEKAADEVPKTRTRKVIKRKSSLGV